MTSSPPKPIEALDALFAARFSCRGFRPEPVAQETITHILETAQRAASWCNCQPWQVIVTSGEGTERFRQVLTDAASERRPNSADFAFPADYRGVYDQRRKESGFQLYNALGIARGDKAAYGRQMLENFRFFGAPHVAIITTDESLGVYGAIDCGSYVGAFLLACQALGISAIAQAALAVQSAAIKAHFDLPPDRKVVCGISFGLADQSHPANGFRTARAPLQDAVRFVTS